MPITSAPSPRSSAATHVQYQLVSEVRGLETKRNERTLGSLDLFVTLTERRAVLELDTSLVRLDRLDVASLAMQRRTLARIALGPCRVYLNALQGKPLSVMDRGHPRSWTETDLLSICECAIPITLACLGSAAI